MKSNRSLSPQSSLLSSLIMNDVVIALGSNIEKEANLPLAVSMLREMCSVTAVSPVYETIPVGLLTQPNFLNTAVRLQTTLSATEIKQGPIHTIETKLKRVRTADPNAPRTIDADIVLFNDDLFEYDGGDGRMRQIPDPDLLKFPHVAIPVADLLPGKPHPQTGESLTTLAQHLLEKVTAKHGSTPLWPRPNIHI